MIKREIQSYLGQRSQLLFPVSMILPFFHPTRFEITVTISIFGISQDILSRISPIMSSSALIAAKKRVENSLRKFEIPTQEDAEEVEDDKR